MDTRPSSLLLWLVFSVVIPSALLAQGKAPASVITLEAGKAIERTLSRSDTQSYQIVLKPSQYFRVTADQRGADVELKVIAPDGSLLMDMDSPNGTAGPETVEAVSKLGGAYRVDVFSADTSVGPGKYEIRLAEVLTPAQSAARLAANRAEVDSTMSWVKRTALPLKGVVAGEGFDDLIRLKEVLRNVRVVGLGEATHGTREFFQLKHRLLEFLVEEMGFTIFAMESSYPASRRINEYVMEGKGDRAQALASQGFWTWDTEEVSAMLDWMRQYNQSAAQGRKVRFVGIDPQILAPGYEPVSLYLRTNAPAFAASADSAIHLLMAVDSFAKLVDVGKITTAAARARDPVYALLGYLTTNEQRLVAQTSRSAFDDMFALARAFAQFVDAYSQDALGSASRDRYMAENLKRVLDSDPGARVVLWAHDAHIAHYMSAGATPVLGSYLKQQLASGYYALGFAFSRGSFQSRNMDAGMGLEEFTVTAPPDDWIESVFGRTGTRQFIVDLRAAPAQGPTAQWFSAPHSTRWIGSSFSAKAPLGSSHALVVPTDAFDGFAYIDSTTRARPNPTGMRGPVR